MHKQVNKTKQELKVNKKGIRYKAKGKHKNNQERKYRKQEGNKTKQKGRINQESIQ